MNKHSLVVALLGALFVTTPRNGSGAPPGPVSYNEATLSVPLRKLLEATMVIKSASGQPKQIDNDQGTFRKVGLQPGQAVFITLVAPFATTGEPVDVLPADGGQIDIAAVGGKLAANGVVAFTFTPGTAYGLYRVWIARADAKYEVQFWHQDPNHPNQSRDIIPAG